MSIFAVVQFIDLLVIKCSNFASVLNNDVNILVNKVSLMSSPLLLGKYINFPAGFPLTTTF